MALINCSNITNTCTFSSISPSHPRYHFPSESSGYVTALQTIVATTCVLSILGASLIIYSYLAYPEIRTRARHMLLHLSIADLFVAVPNLIGVLVHYHSAARQGHESSRDVTHHDSTFCIVQAAFTVFGGEASIFWTVAVAVYMYVLIVLRRPGLGLKVVIASCVVCYLLPLVLTLALGLNGNLGYEVGATPGFCAIKGSKHSHNTTNVEVEVYPIIIGYDVWLYLSFIILPILYIAIRCHVKVKVSKSTSGHFSLSLQSVARTADRKLIFVPLIFMALRVWSLVVDMAVYYLPEEQSIDYRGSYASVVFGILEGIGFSGQGFANGILFCAFTQIVRQNLIKTAKCVPCRNHLRARREYLIAQGQNDDSGQPVDEVEQVEQSSERSFFDSNGHNKPLLDVGSGLVGYNSLNEDLQ